MSSLEPVLNKALDLDARAYMLLQPLTQKTLAFRMQNPDFECSFVFAQRTVHLLGHFESAADVTLTASAKSLLQYVRDQSTPPAQLNIKITGDLLVLKHALCLLNEVKPDWEEGLSYWVGDMAAHKLGVFGQGLWSWSKTSIARVKQQIQFFLSEQNQEWLTRGELESFSETMDHLRIDVERLELKVARLERQQVEKKTNRVENRVEEDAPT